MKRRLLVVLLATLACAAAVLYWWCSGSVQRQLKFRNTQVCISDSDSDISYGSDSACLTIYMFVSYTCRHCRAFLNYDLPQIQKRYIDSGLVRLVLKPIDLAENPDMLSALQLAACMNQNGNADDLLELLITDPFAVYSDDFRQLIDDIIDANPAMAECLLADDFSYVRENNLLFSATSSKGTPIFVTNGHLYAGRRNIDRFCEIIDFELKETN